MNHDVFQLAKQLDFRMQQLRDQIEWEHAYGLNGYDAHGPYPQELRIKQRDERVNWLLDQLRALQAEFEAL